MSVSRSVIIMRSVGRRMVVLGIETSCDDTGAAVVADGVVRSSVLQSQWDLLRLHGGVFPNAAKRAHALVIDAVVDQALSLASLEARQLDAVAVTRGPGLAPCLVVGVTKARQLAASLSLPLIGIHHVAAHALVPILSHPHLQFPYLALILSGGHTVLLLCRGPNESDFSVLGQSLDDNIGEAFDKVWRLVFAQLEPLLLAGGAGAVDEWMSMHPGAALEKLAALNHRSGFESVFPVPLHGRPAYRDSLDFSFSGLKASVSRLVERQPIASIQDAAFVAAAFQHTAIRHVCNNVEKVIGRLGSTGLPKRQTLVIGGGVAANVALQQGLRKLECVENLIVPPQAHCVDNGVMIAFSAWLSGRTQGDDLGSFDIAARWPLPGAKKKN